MREVHILEHNLEHILADFKQIEDAHILADFKQIEDASNKRRS